MLRALYSSASGMQAQQMNLDVIANNLANVNTTGFKKAKVEFQDLLYQTDRAAGAEGGAGNQVPTSLQVGHGSRPVATAKIFTNGELYQTGEKLDIAIHGNGFFKVTLADGSDAFTRDGAFKLWSRTMAAAPRACRLQARAGRPSRDRLGFGGGGAKLKL